MSLRTLLARPGPLARELGDALPERPFELRFWDGTTLEATEPGGPVFTVRDPAAISALLAAPGQLGIGRAYVSGLLAVDDLNRATALLGSWNAPSLDATTIAKLSIAAIAAAGPTPPPSPPEAELAPRGQRHSRARDARAVRHHYDLPPEYFRLFLDESMTYSCAIFSRGATTLEAAQEAKLELICRKLALQPGERVLDVGCGWGSFAIHAARTHGVEVVGLTLSAPQAETARRRVAEAGLDDRVEIRTADYRDPLPDGFDAVSSIGMVEHVGAAQIDAYAETIAARLRPGGRVLNHGIARLRHSDPEAGPFSERYVLPDAAPLHLSTIQRAMERAGLVSDHIEHFGDDYAETLRHWAERFDSNLEEAERLAGAERVRIWRLYLRVARRGFQSGFLSVYQVLGHRPE